MATYFTKEQIEEIARRLATKSVRDSDLPETKKLYQGDFVAVVQNGVNKKVDILNFVDETYKGEPGESAYEIAVRNGFVGTEEEWLESLKAAAKLYPTTGQNTDGSMTQKAITDAIDEKLDADAILDVLEKLTEQQVIDLLGLD